MPQGSKRLDPTDAYMTGQIWHAYDAVRRAGALNITTTMPGWRVDRVYADGSIGDYGDDGTRQASCRYRPRAPVIVHDRSCDCGYRVVRDVYTLLQYVRCAGRYNESTMAAGAPGLGEACGFVLTRALAFGVAAAINDERTGPPGSVRVTGTRVAEVYLPRTYYGEPLPDGLARKIRGKYGVKVRHMPGDLYSFQGSPDTVAPKDWPACMAPTEWHESGNFGLYGAAGAMLSTVIDGERRFLLVKSTSPEVSKPTSGLWQLPGGALEAGETPLEAAQRETLEELAIPGLGGGSVLGSVVFSHPSGWQYTNYAVSLEDTPEHRVDGIEIASAAWFTEEEVLSISESASMVPELAVNIPRILALFPPK